MRFVKVNPGIAPDADAWNLIVASSIGDSETAELIVSKIPELVPVMAYLAGYAAIVFGRIDEDNPEVAECIAEMIDAKYRAEVNQLQPV